MIDPGDQTDTWAGMADPSVLARSDGHDSEAASGQPLILGRRYLLEERIASGGMATVWRAHDEVLARTVAVKMLHDHLASDAAFRERFRREAVAAARLTHPNIVSLYDTGTDGERVYLVLEYVNGPTLRDVIAEVRTLDIGVVAVIGERVARALDFAHSRGLVHRDVKPANILIGEDGTVKVADFGIAKAEFDKDLTRTGTVLGTAAYVAPEQVMAKPLDGKADQYSLGCVLYEALTGQRPFDGDSTIAVAAQRLERDPAPPRSLRLDIPRNLEQIVVRCLARQRDARFRSCGQLADALSAYAGADDQTVRLLERQLERTAVLPTASAVPAAPGSRSVASTSAEREAAAVQRRRRREPPSTVPAEGQFESFLRSEGRWLVSVLALLALAVALVSLGLATGVLPRLAHEIAGSDAAQAAPLPILKLSDFDPLGDRAENGDELRRLIDRNPSTAWRTEGYDTPALGGLKQGVGFWVDLGAGHTITSVHLTTTTPGITYELRIADQPTSAIDGWRTVATVTGAARGMNATSLESPAQGRYLLVWVRGNLQQQGGRFYAAFSELEVEGTTAR